MQTDGILLCFLIDRFIELLAGLDTFSLTWESSFQLPAVCTFSTQEKETALFSSMWLCSAVARRIYRIWSDSSSGECSWLFATSLLWLEFTWSIMLLHNRSRETNKPYTFRVINTELQRPCNNEYTFSRDKAVDSDYVNNFNV